MIPTGPSSGEGRRLPGIKRNVDVYDCWRSRVVVRRYVCDAVKPHVVQVLVRIDLRPIKFRSLVDRNVLSIPILNIVNLNSVGAKPTQFDVLPTFVPREMSVINTADLPRAPRWGSQSGRRTA